MLNSPHVVVLDYGSGNVHSAVKALETTGAKVTLSSDYKTAISASGLVVPGVGAFDAVMRQLSEVNAAEIIQERAAANLPTLGICVGHQVLFAAGFERSKAAQGLNFFSSPVTQLQAAKLPHMGWSSVQAPAESKIFNSIAAEKFYFVHSNAATAKPEVQSPLLKNSEVKITWANYEDQDFIAAIEAGPITGVQFHPEKSGAAGLKLLANWVKNF